MGRIYGGPKLYEGGIGQAQKRGMVVITTGGGPTAYDGWGLNPSLESILIPIQHGIFWFNGFLPLEPFVAWSPMRVSYDERATYLQALDQRLRSLFVEEPIRLPKMADFPNWGHDQKNRYVVVVERKREPDEQFRSLVPAELAKIEQFKRQGVLLDFQMTAADDPHWRAFMTFRASDEDEVEQHLNELPLVDYLKSAVSRLSRPD